MKTKYNIGDRTSQGEITGVTIDSNKILYFIDGEWISEEYITLTRKGFLEDQPKFDICSIIQDLGNWYMIHFNSYELVYTFTSLLNKNLHEINVTSESWIEKHDPLSLPCTYREIINGFENVLRDDNL
jgi:hypothetical protein